MNASSSQRLVLEGVKVPPPVFYAAMEAENAASQPALDAALAALCREDPSLEARTDPDTSQVR